MLCAASADTDISSLPYKTPWNFYREGMILPVFVCLPVVLQTVCSVATAGGTIRVGFPSVCLRGPSVAVSSGTTVSASAGITGAGGTV